MGKKMKLPLFLSNQTDQQQPPRSSSSSTTSNSWPWPSCTQTRTLSFRATSDIFKTMNSAFSDTTTTTITRITNAIDDEPQHYSSLFTNSSPSHETDDIDPSASFSTASDDQSGVDPVEAVIQGLRSERLFFEPGETSSILDEANNKLDVPFKESVALSLESRNPYVDFKKSMEEMVEAHGIKDWEGLEELLCLYLKMNGKDNHGYIVGAFVDLLVGLVFINNNDNIKNNNSTSNIKSCRCSNCDSPYSPLSFCNTSSSSSLSSSNTPNCVSSLIGVVSDQEIETPCLSSLLETEEEDNDDVSS